MKIIHTADIHLDSKLGGMDGARASERRNELIGTFIKMVQYGAKNGVSAIIIAGDLFDVRIISATARNAVYQAIVDNPEIRFFYLCGNHDSGGFLEPIMEKYKKLPDNLFMFGEEWTSYEIEGEDCGSVVITGAELSRENNQKLADSLLLDRDKINIVTLHGQETETAKKKDAEVIPIREYRDRGIDYLALGHIHAPKIEKLDARGKYSYCGCLEGRGFDECGPRGFNLLSIDKNGVEAEFIPFAKRTVFDICVDVSGCVNSDEALTEISKTAAAEGVTEEDLLKVRLSGKVSAYAEFDRDYIEDRLSEKYYYTRVADETSVFIDYNDFAGDNSLKGEYVRYIGELREKGEITEEEAGRCISLGIRLILGEEKLS